MKRIAVLLAILATATACKPSPPPVPPRHTITCQLPPKFREDMAYANIKIDRDGRLTWNNTPINRDQLNEYLGDASKDDPQPRVTFGPHDANAPYSQVSPLLRLAYGKKAYRVGMITSYFLELPTKPGAAKAHAWVECWAGPTNQPEPKMQDVIAITSANGFTWNGQAVSHQELTKRIEQAGRATPQPIIFLKIAPEARFFVTADLMYEIDGIGPRWLRFETD